ncbi:NAD(P)-dependent oxidoreductase [Paenibacillus sp. MZ03-122A]|uniref:NAD(P)-dependent oxidoreductase n=1 Tax=Paenibacillus sp. MZ03-122A TaxID=2962033 RepID=UPI0020B7F34F|nr:SDR family oxidoreductase [Paenibacillus sp. MZ03-122A]MCP3779658.1 SDR family oxidoreductase [Paenibacillus sp. MZ03-122A]
MNLLLLGATGRVGRYILDYALADGHAVTVLVRSPDKLEDYAPGYGNQLQIVQGDATNAEDVAQALKGGATTVISALNTDGTTTLSANIALLIRLMQEQSISRLITVGTAGILQSRTEPDLYRYESSETRRRSTRAAEEHRRVYELLRESALDWTIVCPTYLPDGEHTGIYRVEKDFLPEGGSQITTADTADFTYRQCKSYEFIRTRVGIAY